MGDRMNGKTQILIGDLNWAFYGGPRFVTVDISRIYVFVVLLCEQEKLS